MARPLRSKLGRMTKASFFTACLVIGLYACKTEAPETATDAGVTDATTPVDAALDAAAPFPLGQSCEPVTLPEGTEEKACSECSQSRCCDSRKTLIAFPDAADLAACLAPKTCDSDCEAACFAKYPAPAQALLDHGACKTYRCTGICTDPPDTCQACLNDKCLKESLACDRSKDCFLAAGCIGACPTKNAACVDACFAKFPARAEVGALDVCKSARCQNECP